MKNEKRKLNIALTLLFAIVIFLTVVVAVLLSGIVLYLLIHFEIISAKGDYLADARHVNWYMGFICVCVGSVLTMLTTTILLHPLQRMIRKTGFILEIRLENILHLQHYLKVLIRLRRSWKIQRCSEAILSIIFLMNLRHRLSPLQDLQNF